MNSCLSSGKNGFGFSFIDLDFGSYGAEFGSKFHKYFAMSSLILRSFWIDFTFGSTDLYDAPYPSEFFKSSYSSESSLYI